MLAKFRGFCMVLGLVCLLNLGACSGKERIMLADPPETGSTWQMARYFQAQGRYELAKQYYGLALSSARSNSAMTALQRELFAVELQIQTMR